VDFKESYQNPWGTIRIGKVLEDLDALAGNVAYMHVVRGAREHGEGTVEQPVIVTASVDRIRVSGRPTMNSDMLLEGGVTAVGGSSVEIRMVASCENGGSWLEAYFTFVALSSKTNRPTPVVGLKCETEEEIALERKGLKRMKAKKDRRAEDKRKMANNEMLGSKEENSLASNLLSEGYNLARFPALGASDGHIFMEETSLHNALICQPQHRNMHNRIFGGFLMRRGYELAFSTAYAFTGSKPTFDEVDDIAFLVPVNVGDLCLLDSRVLYTIPGVEGGNSQVFVEVIVLVAKPEQPSSEVSNRMYFTFSVDARLNVKKILPEDLAQAKRMAGRIFADRLQVAEDEEE